MTAVSNSIKLIVQQLQSLPSLENAYLGGGTNLALRYDHRISIDVDLFFSGIIGRAGFENIIGEVSEFYKGDVFGINCLSGVSEQYIFLRFFIKTKKTPVKVDVLQNMIMVDPPEIFNELRLVSENDIGLFKLMTAGNRASYKDIYDLDYLTDQISLITLFQDLADKQLKFKDVIHRNVFDLDERISPVSSPDLLLKFEQPIRTKQSRPDHSHYRVEVINGNKSWLQARSSWRRKVRELFDHLGIDFPGIQVF